MSVRRWMIVGLILSLSLSAYAISEVQVLRQKLDREQKARLSRVKANEARILEAETQIVRLHRDLKRAAEKPVKSEEKRQKRGEPPSSMAAVVTQELADARDHLERTIAQQVEAQVDERMQRFGPRNRNHNGEWEPAMTELVLELGLSSKQDEAARAIFDESRDEVFELFSISREGGGSLADDLVDDLRTLPEPGDAMKRFFGRLMSEKVPGVDRTYLAELIKIRGRVFESLGDEFEDEQMVKLKNLRIDPLQVGTGYDPMKRYIEARLQE